MSFSFYFPPFLRCSTSCSILRYETGALKLLQQLFDRVQEIIQVKGVFAAPGLAVLDLARHIFGWVGTY